MKPIKQYPLRKIAENELTKHFGDLDAVVRSDLATSLVRQWITNDGHAGLVTPTCQYWFQMVTREGGGLEVGVSKPKGNWARILTQDWHVAADEIPGLLHQLNLCQSVMCRNSDDRTIQLRIDPKERIVRCEEVVGEDERLER